MDTLVLSTLLIQSLGIIATVIALALSSCLPNRHLPRTWVAVVDSAAPRAVPAVGAGEVHLEEAGLPRAA